jgi:hypothetical protein
MGSILRSPTNNNAILLTPRTGSHSLTLAAIAQWWPDTVLENSVQHPACWIPHQESYRGGTKENVGVIVRNPVERFRSMIAHKHLNVDEQLARPMYGPLPAGPFVRYFRFEDQLDDAAEWLGLQTPLPQEDATSEANKPLLTPEQEARVREIYAADIELWESLQEPTAE